MCSWFYGSCCSSLGFLGNREGMRPQEEREKGPKGAEMLKKQGERSQKEQEW